MPAPGGNPRNPSLAEILHSNPWVPVFFRQRPTLMPEESAPTLDSPLKSGRFS